MVVLLCRLEAFSVSKFFFLDGDQAVEIEIGIEVEVGIVVSRGMM